MQAYPSLLDTYGDAGLHYYYYTTPTLSRATQLPESLAGEVATLLSGPPELVVVDVKLARDQVVLCALPEGMSWYDVESVTAAVDGPSGKPLSFNEARSRPGSICSLPNAASGG